jgi:hypothetical protein
METLMREVAPGVRSVEAHAAFNSEAGPLDLRLSSAYSLRSRYDLPEAAYLQTVETGALQRVWSERLSLDRATVVNVDELGGSVAISRRSDAGEVTLLRFPDDTVALLDVARGTATIEIAGTSVAAVERRRDHLAKLLGASDPPAGEVPVTFWAAGQGMPRSARRRISAPAWSEITDNYESTTSAGVSELATLANPDVPESGRLILWHGLPGTGKTSALRALARAWEPWCSTHFVTDPEACLGANTSYLLDVLMSGSTARDRNTPGWKLIVLEDSGELLTADAHERRPGSLAVVEHHRRHHRSGHASDRPRDDQRAARSAPPGSATAWSLLEPSRVSAAPGFRSKRLARGAWLCGAKYRACHNC